MSEESRNRLKQWLASGEVQLHPLTLPQRELWEASPVPAGDVANHICAFIQMKGAITSEDIQASIQKVVERQEVLRLSFLPGKSQPLQMVRSTGVAAIRFREITSAQHEPEALEELMEEIFSEPFDLVRGPLYRVEVLKHGTDDLVLVFAIHHAIADGWTLGVFVQDLVAAYFQGLKKTGGGLPPVPLTYSAWNAAERAFWQPAELERRAGYWKSHLAGAARLWSRPAPPAAAAGKLHRWISHIPADLTGAVRALVRKTNATLFNTLFAGFQATLAQWTGADDILVGTPVANRNKPAVRETMGYFSGVVPLRGQIDSSRPFSDTVRAVHQETVESFANVMPFAELARALGDQASPGYNPVFDVRFALQNHPVPDVTLPGLSVKLRMRSTGTARFDLACEVTEEGEQLEVVWLSRRSMFSQADVEKLDRMFSTTLSNVCRSPESRMAVLVN